MKTYLIVFAALLTGCSALGLKQPEKAREWFSASCSGFANWDACHQKARQTCPEGYDIGGQEESLIAQKRILHYACKSK